jgi:trehalose 6-phosphate phosphatase
VCTGLDAAVFAGDDAGDLAAFDALDRLRDDGALSAAVRVAVRSDEVPAALVDRADVVVDGPAGLAALLAQLGASLRRALP